MGYNTTHKLTTIPPNAKGAAKMVANPAIIFVVQGAGEETGDEWIMYVHEGRFKKFEREDWVPPGVPQVMLDNRDLAMDAAEREQSAATERRERDLLAKLQAKYQGGDT